MISEYFLGERKVAVIFVPLQQDSETGTHSSLEKVIAEHTEYWTLWIRKAFLPYDLDPKRQDIWLSMGS